MNENQKLETKDSVRTNADDDIELIDYIILLWKWKYLIILGCLVSVIFAGGISYYRWKNQEDVFRTEIIIQPAVKSIKENGGKTYIESVENIKKAFEKEMKYDFIKKIGEFKNFSLNQIIFTIPEKNEIVKISIDGRNPNESETVLNHLMTFLSDHYKVKKKSVVDAYNLSIKNKKLQIKELEQENDWLEKKYDQKRVSEQEELENRLKISLFEKKEKENKIRIIQDRIKSTGRLISILNKNLIMLTKKRDGFRETISKGKTKDDLYLIDRIRETIVTENDLKDNLVDYHSNKTDTLKALYDIEFIISKISKQLEEIKQRDNQPLKSAMPVLYNNIKKIEGMDRETKTNNLNVEKLMKRNPITIIQQPLSTVLQKPIKNNTAKNSLIAFFLGIFIMIILSFLIEYLTSHLKKNEVEL